MQDPSVVVHASKTPEWEGGLTRNVKEVNFTEVTIGDTMEYLANKKY